MLVWVYKSEEVSCIPRNGKYLRSFIDDSIITCDEIIEVTKNIPTKAVPTNFNEKLITCKIRSFYILFVFLSITISLLITINSLLLNIHYHITKPVTG